MFELNNNCYKNNKKGNSTLIYKLKMFGAKKKLLKGMFGYNYYTIHYFIVNYKFYMHVSSPTSVDFNQLKCEKVSFILGERVMKIQRVIF